MAAKASPFAVAALLFACASAQAQQMPASPADSDPVKLCWMQGSPPPPEKRILFSDGSFYQFPKSRWSFAHMRQLVPTVRVTRGQGQASVFRVALRDDPDKVTFTPLLRTDRMRWDEAFQAVYGDAVLILHKGRIVYERYNCVMTPDQPHIAFSVTKSYFGILAEMLVEEGRLDETAPVARYIPELAQSGFCDATVRQVLDMTTALDFSEDYTDPKAGIAIYSVASGLLPAPAGYAGPRSSYDYLPMVAKKGVHGDGFTYRSINTEVLGWLIARVTGKAAHHMLSERIWSKIGAENDADLVVDSAGAGVAAGGLNLTVRDMARFGETMRLNGRFNGQQIIPATIVKRIRVGAKQSDFAQAATDISTTGATKASGGSPTMPMAHSTPAVSKARRSILTPRPRW